MKEPIFTIIVPVYNSESYLDKCLRSILGQSYRDFELLIVDDGSTDASGSICDKYADGDARVKVIHVMNAGVSIARNTALEMARGTFITFVDSDDWVEPDYLQTIIDNIGDNDLMYFGSTFHSPDKAVDFGFEESLYDDIEAAHLFLDTSNDDVHYTVVPWNKVFRKSIIVEHNIHFPEHVPFGEDTIFTLEYQRHSNTLKVISDIIYHYLRHGGSHISSYKNYLPLVNAYREAVEETHNEELAMHFRRNMVCFTAAAAQYCANPFVKVRLTLNALSLCHKYEIKRPEHFYRDIYWIGFKIRVYPIYRWLKSLV